VRLTRSRHLLPAALAGLLVGASAGCSSPGPAGSSSAGPSTTAAAVGTHPVATRTLDLSDPGRITDPTPDEPGDEVPGRDLPTTVWYPSDGEGPYPVVVFSHGIQSGPSAYGDLLSAWASAGFVVAAPVFPLTNVDVPPVYLDVLNQPADVSFVLTQVLALHTTAGDVLEGQLDTAEVAAAGHSAGAVTTVGLLNDCCVDERISAAVVLAGTLTGFGPSFARPGVPTLFEHGTSDDTVPADEGRAAFEAAPAEKAFLALRAATHSSPYTEPDDPSFSTVLATTTDFLRCELSGDASARTALGTVLSDPKRADLVDDRLGG
jgi:dienelactone hydrolase